MKNYFFKSNPESFVRVTDNGAKIADELICILCTETTSSFLRKREDYPCIQNPGIYSLCVAIPSSNPAFNPLHLALLDELYLRVCIYQIEKDVEDKEVYSLINLKIIHFLGKLVHNFETQRKPISTSFGIY